MNVKQFIRILATVTAVLLMASYAVAQGRGGGHGNGGGGGGGGGRGPSYEIVELDSWDGLYESFHGDINNTGLVVGWVLDAISGDVSPACWTVDRTGGDVTSTLHLLAGGGTAQDVNDVGEIVGRNNNGEPVYWENWGAEPLALPTTPGTTESSASAINSDGVICGYLKVPDSGGQLSNVAVIWQTSGSDPIELPKLQSTDSTYAGAINDLDSEGTALVVGREENAGVSWTVRLVDGAMVVDPPVVLDPQGSANGVNNSGMICGNARYVTWEAVVWDGNSTQILDRSATIPEFGGRHPCNNASAYAINDGGVIVGYGNFDGWVKAVVWPSPSGAMLVLDKFLRGPTIASLSYAWDVNDAGEIVCRGWNNDLSLRVLCLAIPK